MAASFVYFYESKKTLVQQGIAEKFSDIFYILC